MSVLCIGAAHWDIIARAEGRVAFGNDLPGVVERRPGGVACNVALALARAGVEVELAATIGSDPAGEELAAALAEAGIVLRLQRIAAPTDRYIAIEDGSGALVAAIADTRALEAGAATLIDGLATTDGPVVLDGNLPEAALATLPAFPDLRLVPASPAKAVHLLPLITRSAGVYANLSEATALTGRAGPESAAAELVQRGARFALVTAGAGAAVLARAGGTTSALPRPAAGSVTGAGDVLVAGHIAAELRGLDDAAALDEALAAAAHHLTGDTA